MSVAPRYKQAGCSACEPALTPVRLILDELEDLSVRVVGIPAGRSRESVTFPINLTLLQLSASSRVGLLQRLVEAGVLEQQVTASVLASHMLRPQRARRTKS